MSELWLSALAKALTPVAETPGITVGLRAAAVLMVIHIRDREPAIPLIVRTDYGRFHGGQIALPGGAQEPDDGNLAGTALREASEEVGLDTSALQMLGSLPPVRVTVSGFEVVPFVAWTEEEPELFPNDAEVAAIIYLPLRTIMAPDAAREVPNPPGSLHPFMYEYSLPEGRLWGATARMVHSLGDVLSSLPSQLP